MKTINPTIDNAVSPTFAGQSGSAAKTIDALRARLKVWKQRYTTRRVLSQLNDYQLRDIGISRAQAQTEANTPFWKAGS